MHAAWSYSWPITFGTWTIEDWPSDGAASAAIASRAIAAAECQRGRVPWLMSARFLRRRGRVGLQVARHDHARQGRLQRLNGRSQIDRQMQFRRVCSQRGHDEGGEFLRDDGQSVQ